MSRPAPYRCFLSEVPSAIAHHHHTLFRLMGIVVAVTTHRLMMDDNGMMMVHEHPQQDVVLVALDDGTTTVSIQVTTAMMEAIHVQIGKLLEVVCRYDDDDDNNNNNGGVLIATQLVWIRNDPLASEALRALDIEYQRTHHHSRHPHEIWRGYVPIPTLQEDDLMDVIQSQGDIGVTKRELGIVLEIDKETIEDMLQSLEAKAYIYRNEKGRYVPLETRVGSVVRKKVV